MLYHSQVFMPKRIKGLFPSGGHKLLTYSQHAREQAARKEIPLPPTLTISQYELIELEVQAGQWTKAVLRQQARYGELSSVVLVVMKGDERTRYFVKTLWMNSVDDEHATLDPSPYAQR